MSDDIRACVARQDFERFFTWYKSGKVPFWMRGLDVAGVEHASTVAQFNAILERHGIVGLRGGDALKFKVSERLPEHG